MVSVLKYEHHQMLVFCIYVRNKADIKKGNNMSNSTKNRFEALSNEEKKEVRKQWGKTHNRHFYCVYVKDFHTPYYIEIPQQTEQLNMKFKLFYICDYYGFELEDIRRAFKVSMSPCFHNWHPNILVDLSYPNTESNNTYVKTLSEQGRTKTFVFDEKKVIEKTTELEVA